MKSVCLLIINLFLILLVNNIKSDEEYYSCDCSRERYNARLEYYGNTCIGYDKRYLRLSENDGELLSVYTRPIFNEIKYLFLPYYFIKENGIYYTYIHSVNPKTDSEKVCFNQEKLKFYPCNNEKQFENVINYQEKDFIYIKRLEERNHYKQTFPNTFNSNEKKYLSCTLSNEFYKSKINGEKLY